MSGAPEGKVRVLLRLEGLTLLLLSITLYHHFDFAWPSFFLWFFLPDVALFAYLAGPRLGAIAYNLSHSLTGPLLLAAFAIFSANPSIYPVCMIWLAHIGFDRALGYGLKYQQGFTFTHLGRIGKKHV